MPEFKVNGKEFKTDNPKPTATELLEIAKEVVPDVKDTEWALMGQKREYKKSDTIDLSEDNQFTTIPTGPTRVSWRENV